MDFSSFLVGSATTAVGVLIPAVSSFLSDKRKERVDNIRQLRALAAKLTLEQWALDKEEWEKRRAEVMADPANEQLLRAGIVLPHAQIIKTFKSIIESLEKN